MAGHSKWSKVKHQKESTDAVKARVFTRHANAISLAVRLGGPDPDHNIRLRFAIESARKDNTPKANIDRAIERGNGGGDSSQVEEIVYETIGPFGVGLIIVAVTDNRQRTVSHIKQIVEKKGGTLGTVGSVSYLFSRVGRIEFGKGSGTFESCMELALNVGALDMEEQEGTILMYTDVQLLHTIREKVEVSMGSVLSCDISYRPINATPVTNEQRDVISDLISRLESLDDVHAVFPSL